MAIKELKGKIEKIENQSESVRLFKITFDKEFEFESGQFINLGFEDDGEKFMKPYSICSSPKNKSFIELSIKLVKDGRATPHLWKKKEGDEVSVKGPFGLFKLRNDKEKLVFIGTGTGIAPLRSMILDLIENNVSKEIVLIFGCRYEKEILFENEFEELEKKYPNFKYVRVVSRPTENWVGRSGHVQDNFDVIDSQNSEFYICGLPAMFDGVKEKLLSLGTDEKVIFHEVFR